MIVVKPIYLVPLDCGVLHDGVIASPTLEFQGTLLDTAHYLIFAFYMT